MQSMQEPSNLSDPTTAMQWQMIQQEQFRQTMEMMQQQNNLMMKQMERQDQRYQKELEDREMLKQTENKRMQEIVENLKNDNKDDTKYVKCPKWAKSEAFRAYKRRLENWDSIEKGKGKYLKLLEALQEEGRKKEKERIELEEQNNLIDPNSTNVIKDIIEKMEIWFGKPQLDEACEAWKRFKDISRDDAEAVEDYILKYETCESNLKCSGIELQQVPLAIQFVDSLNVNEDQRRSILANIKMENTDTIYEDIKKAVRILKGSIVEGCKNVDDKDGEEINFVNNATGNRRSRSKSRQRYPSRSFRNHNHEENRGGYRNSRSEERGKSRDRYQERSRDRYRGRSKTRYQESRDGYGNGRSSKDRSNSKNRNDRRNSYQYEEVNMIYRDSLESVDKTMKDMHDNLDKAIVDCGTTKTVAGKYWMDKFLEIAEEGFKDKITKSKEKRFFRFGNSVRYPSKQEVSIPFKLGQLESVIHVSVVDANIPLLLGRPDLKKLGLVINFENDTVFTTRTLETFSLDKTTKGHLALPIFEVSTDDDILILENCTKEDKFKKIKKIHEVMCHPKADVLTNFFLDSTDNDDETLDLIKEVSNKCDVCIKFPKSPSRPKVAFPVSRDFNQCVALDLKENKKNKQYILYCIDTFSRLTRGVIIKDKKPATIVKGIHDCWILGKGTGPGIPNKFLFDNGGEFNNPQTIDLAEKNGINLQGVTAAYSPFSNGLCEKNHEVCDRMVAKIKAGNSNLKDQKALEYALFAKNIEPNNKGFSAFQIVYGTNPTIPGIINSTPASLSTRFESEDVRKHIEKIDLAREAFREADNNERIKRALKSRIQSSNHEFYKLGDRVYFKEIKKTEWSGPAKVLGQDGKVIFLRYGNRLKRVHSTRVLRAGEEYLSIKPIEDETVVDNQNHTKDQMEKHDEDKINTGDDTTENVVNNTDKRVTRQSTIRRPNKNRRIKFKNMKDENWMYGEVKNVGNNSGIDQYKCSILKENNDVYEVDFSDTNNIWEYEQEQCDLCHKGFDNKRGLKKHKVITHKKKDPYTCDQCNEELQTMDDLKNHKHINHEEIIQPNQERSVHFNIEEINYNDGGCDECNLTFSTTNDLTNHIHNDHTDDFKNVRQAKMRFIEVNRDRKLNEKWIEKNNFIHEEEIKYAEIKENEDNFEKCQEAKAKELQNFDEYRVYDEVDDVGQHVMGTRYVLTEKDDGRIKARFVVKGFQDDTFNQSDSPTASRETLKVFFTIAANEGWDIEGSDVRSAFLQSEVIDRDVYVQPPAERQKPGMVWKLNKPAYGLEDASRKWFQSTESTLLSLGMIQSLSDKCLFYLYKDGCLQGILLIHVDDFLTSGSDIFKEEVILKLREKYTFGKISSTNFVFTGLNIRQNEKNEIFVNQADFVKKLEVHEFKRQDPETILKKDENRLVRQIQGQLSWAATQTRPDLAYDALQLSTVLNKASYKDAKNANKVALKAKHENIELKFSKLGNIEDLHIELFADASLGNMEKDMETKSVMGYFICLANKDLKMSPLHWKSKVIDKVAEDIKTAETLALETAIDDAIHLSNMLMELYSGKQQHGSIPIVVNEDSLSLVESLYSTKKVKRKTMRVVVSSIQQRMKKNIISEINHVKSEDNIADVFTKKGVSTNRIMTAIEKGSLFH